MKKVILLIIVSIFTIQTQAQEDLKAKQILDKLSSKTKAYTSIKATFQLIISSKKDGLNETQDGSIQIKGNKYNLGIKGQEILSDGKTVWTYIKESDEVHINSIGSDESDGTLSPNKLFTLYETGFKYKYVEEKNNIHTINLYPKDANSKAFHRITLFIDKLKEEIKEVKVFGKDGSETTYRIKTFITNSPLADALFVFDKSKHPKVEVIDLRE
ncbi:MAG: outer membrane lipoprotein carrier protein LolA [Flavobacteriales bacterium]|nr:outer membrane lipoprotein carrier protein LolA [Flavobacteriales bacterium]